MKKLFQIIFIYTLGILCVLSFVWRASNLDKNNELSANYTEEVFVFNN